MTIWSKTISSRAARDVARMLKAEGYNVTIADVREQAHIINLGRYLEPADGEARQRIVRRIAAVCGVQPK